MAVKAPDTAPITSLSENPWADPLEPAEIKVDGRQYKSAEALFLASSFISNQVWDAFQAHTGSEARVAYNKLIDSKEPQRPSWLEKTTEAAGAVPGFMELLRRTFILKYQQNPALCKQLLDTHYRSIKLVINPNGVPSNWISDVHLNATLVIVRFQLREWKPVVVESPEHVLLG